MSYSPINVFRSVNLRGGAKGIGELVKNFRELGVKALGICNQGNLISMLKFHEESIDAGIKPIFGMQVELVSKEKEGANDFLQLFAFNMTGYFNLVALASQVNFEGKQLKLAISQETLSKHLSGLVGIAGDKSTIYSYLTNYQFEEAKNLAKVYASLFSQENFYIEVQTKEKVLHLHLNQMVMQVAHQLTLPIIATKKIINSGELSNRYSYVYPAFDTGELSEHESYDPNEKINFNLVSIVFYFDFEDENLRSMSFADEVIENTRCLIDKINFEDEFCKKYYPIMEGSADCSAIQYLEEIAIVGLKTHYFQVEELHLNRLKEELEIIGKKGWAYFFLVYADICAFAVQNGAYVSGSCGQFEGSLIAFVLDFTNIDPLRYGLAFELINRNNRLYNMNVIIDASREKHPYIVNYFYERYGEKNVSKIVYSNGGSTNAKRRLRVVARAVKVPMAKIDRFMNLFYPKEVLTKAEQLKREYHLRQWCESDPQVQGMMDIANHIYNISLPIEDDCHLLLSNGLINDQMPVFQGENGLVSQYSNFEIKDFHLLKIYIEDKGWFSDSTLLNRTLELIGQTKQVRIDINEIPRNDPAVFAMISRGELTGIPYFYNEESFVHIINRVKLEVFEDFLFIVNLSFRDYKEINGKSYISSKRGYFEIKSKCSALWLSHPVLMSILSETEGYIFYEEQVIHIAHTLAKLSKVEATDFLSSIFQREIESEQALQTKEKYRQKFFDGCLASGLAIALVEEIYEEIAQFSKSSKSFVASMALPTYQMSYLKWYYPEEFLSAYYTLMMNSHKTYIEEFANECKRLQIEILPPNLNESAWGLKPTPGKIRLGFGMIKHTSKRAIEDLIRIRMKGPFLSLEDFCDRCAKHQGDLATFEALNNAGCFDFFGQSRNKTIVKIMLAIELYGLKNISSNS